MVVFGSGTLRMKGICEMKRVLTFSVAFAADLPADRGGTLCAGALLDVFTREDMDGSIAVGQWPTGGVGVRATEC